MTDIDPRAAAEAKFRDAPLWSGLDLLTRCATDPSLAIATLLNAVRPVASDGSTICELGFGDGWLLDALMSAFPAARVCGLDRSPALVRRAQQRFDGRVPIIRGDIEALPFPDASLDAIVTCWTLYFIQDIDAALADMRRSVRPGGRVVAATVARDHMIEHEEMLAAATHAALGREQEPDLSVRFDLESGAAHMQRAFEDVELGAWRGELRVPDIGTAMELFDAYPPPQLSEHEITPVRNSYRTAAEARLASHGEIRVRRHDGAFVATVPSV